MKTLFATIIGHINNFKNTDIVNLFNNFRNSTSFFKVKAVIAEDTTPVFFKTRVNGG